MREPRLPNFDKIAETLTNATPVNSALLTVQTSHFVESASSNLKIDSQMTHAKCQEALVCGKGGPSFSSFVLSLDGATL